MRRTVTVMIRKLAVLVLTLILVGFSAGCGDSEPVRVGTKAMMNMSMATASSNTMPMGLACDSAYEWFGFCEGDHLIFCAGGTWWDLNCGVLGFSCEEDDFVDCY